MDLMNLAGMTQQNIKKSIFGNCTLTFRLKKKKNAINYLIAETFFHFVLFNSQALHVAMANNERWSFYSNSPKELVLSLYTIHSKRSCRRLIFLLNTLLKNKNIQINGLTILHLYKSFHYNSSLFRLT